MEDFLDKHLNKIVVLILVMGLLVSWSSIYVSTKCEGDSMECLEDKSLTLLSDVVRDYNILAYVAEHWTYPVDVEPYVAFDDRFKLEEKGGYGAVYHAPLYYYLTAPVFLLAEFFNINKILAIQIFSSFLILLTNLVFFFFAKSVGRYVEKKSLIVYSTAIFAFLPTHLFISRLTSPDALFYFLIVASMYMYFRFMEEKTKKRAIFLGIVVFFSLLSRQTTLGIIIAMFIHMVFYHLKKQYKKRNLLFISLFISSLGSVFFIRNVLLFGIEGTTGDFFFPLKGRVQDILLRTVKGFWGGVYGSYEGLGIFLIIVVLILSLLTIYGIIRLLIKKEVPYLNFLILIGIVHVLFSFHFFCHFDLLFKTGLCYGMAAQGRFLLPIELIIAIFSGFALIQVEKIKYLKYIVPLFVIIACIIFGINFIYAFV